MSDYQILTVEQTEGGGLALRRKDADDAVSPGASPVKAQASGNPAVIPDAAEGKKLLSVRVPFGPGMAGYGNPSPTNIRALSPRMPVLRHCGPNLYTGVGDTPRTTYNDAGEILPTTIDARLTDFIPVAGESEVLLLARGAAFGAGRAIRAGAYDADGNMLNGGALVFYRSTRYAKDAFVVTLPEGTASIRVSLTASWDLGIYAGSAAESFALTAPAEAGDVYGGIWDPVAGTLTVDRAYMSLTGTEGTWMYSGTGEKKFFGIYVGNEGDAVNGSGICSHFSPITSLSTSSEVGQLIYTSAGAHKCVFAFRPENVAEMSLSDFRAWVAEQASAGTPVQITYKLTNPQVYAVDAETIAALTGANTLFSDAWEYGMDYDAAAEYIQDTGAAIESANASTRAMIGEASGGTASRSLAVGEYVTVGAALYRVTAAVGSGETLVPGSNVVETTVGAELIRLAGMINA